MDLDAIITLIQTECIQITGNVVGSALHNSQEIVVETSDPCSTLAGEATLTSIGLAVLFDAFGDSGTPPLTTECDSTALCMSLLAWILQ